MKCGSPGDLPRCDVGDDKLDLQVKLIEFMEDNAGHKQVLNHQYVTIITNAAFDIISTKMNVCFVFQFDSVLAFFVKNSCLPITE